MTGSTSPNSLAEEGARVTRAINDSIKRFSAMSGSNLMPEGMPPFMHAAQEYNAKLLEFGIANTTAMFEYFRKMAEAKSTPELVEMATRQARAQFDTFMEQAKQLQAIAQKGLPKGPGG
jgi:hypothetical protein